MTAFQILKEWDTVTDVPFCFEIEQFVAQKDGVPSKDAVYITMLPDDPYKEDGYEFLIMYPVDDTPTMENATVSGIRSGTGLKDTWGKHDLERYNPGDLTVVKKALLEILETLSSQD